MKFIFLTPAIILTLFEMLLFGQIFLLEKRKLMAVDDLLRIQKATLHAFHDRKPPTEIEFWKEVGKKEPLKDPWGNPYRLTMRDKDLAWRSGGADKNLYTADDLSKIIPIQDGLILYLENKAFEPNTGMRVNDAK